MTPTIVDLPAMTLVGFEARFISAMSDDANNFEVIPPLWHQLINRRDEIAAVDAARSYGACRPLPPNERGREDELLYLAAFTVAPDAPVPAGMTKWSIAPMRYALFTHRGPISRLTETIDFAHGTWMPRSEFVHAGGVELERYDERFRGDAPESELDYLVPIQRKQS